MKNLATALLMILWMHIDKAAYCRFAYPDSDKIKKILEVREHVFGSKTFLDVVNEAEENESVTPQISRLCSEILPEAQIFPGIHDRPLLGGGTFGVVVSADLGHQEAEEARAVKILSFTEFLRAEILKALSKMKNAKIVAADIIEHMRTLEFIAPPKEPDQNCMNENEVFSRDLSFLSAKSFKGFSIKKLGDFATSALNAFWNLLVKEIDLNEAIRDRLAGTPNTVAEYDGCYIDSNLNVYIVMKKLGPTLFMARESCKSPLTKGGFEVTLPRYLSMLLTVSQLNDKGIAICDIKPENILLNLDYDPSRFYFADFGLSADGKPCSGGSLAYFPPENFFADLRQVAFYYAVEKGAQPAGLADAYSLGTVMGLIELDFDKFDEIFIAHGHVVEELNELNENYDEFISEARFMYSQTEAELNAQTLKFVHVDQFRQQILQQTHKLLGMVILSMIDPEFETRLTTQGALYLVYVLSKLNVQSMGALAAFANAEQHSKALQTAEALFSDSLELERAMSGAYAEGVNFEEDNRNPALVDLAAQIKLPSYKDAVKEVISMMSDNAKRLLI